MKVSHPGIYVDEVQGPPRIAAAPTAVTAFIGKAPQGPRDGDAKSSPTPIRSWAEYEQVFGGLAPDSTLGHAVKLFFENGGGAALIVRVGGDGPQGDDDISAPALAGDGRGLWALDRAQDMNLLCIPPLAHAPGGDISARTRQAAAEYCAARRAMFIVDPLARWRSADDVLGADGVTGAEFGLAPAAHAGLYFPGLRMADPLHGGAPTVVAPCGAVAGVIARIDATRGVWRAPAGGDAQLRGVLGPAVALSNADQERLNPAAVNCLRQFADRGSLIWGARCWSGQDAAGSEWKYLSVRRLASFLETSISRGTQWAAFEPPGEPLWARLRNSVGAFLQDLFAAGAFQGVSPDESWFVHCGAETHSPDDLAAGISNIVVGFAPLKPAEFVALRITHRWARQGEEP